MADLPQCEHVYQNHHLDSTRWDDFPFRSGDIIISTSYKAGTTWTQNIVGQLILGETDYEGSVLERSPWLDMRIRPLEPQVEMLEEQTHRRYIKTHLPLDGLPYREDVQYVVVGRDARDVFMSLYNHYYNHTDVMMQLLNETPNRVGPPIPRCPEDINWLWRQWISLGWFDWEHDGWPYWSHFHHCKTWWEWRHLPNVLLVHYNDLKQDLDGEMRRIADYLGLSPSEQAWPTLVQRCTFEDMKKNAEKLMPGAEIGWKGGARQFIYKGTNQRWKGVLTEDELALYPEAVERTLTRDAGAWLEQGRLATGALD